MKFLLTFLMERSAMPDAALSQRCFAEMNAFVDELARQGKRTAVVAPVDLVPREMEHLRVDKVWRGLGYCLDWSPGKIRWRRGSCERRVLTLCSRLKTPRTGRASPRQL